MSIKRNRRVSASGQRARQTYNELSRYYDLIAGKSERKYINMGIAQLSPIPGEVILEIGCGTGHGLVALAKSVIPSGKVFGLDISEGMLARASSLINRIDGQTTIHLQQGDGRNLPYSSNQFSALFFSFSLELFDPLEIPKVLEECKRTLVPGGRIGIVCLSKQDSIPVRIYDWFHKKFPNLIDCRPITVQAYLLQANFLITNIKSKKMWGLPVIIVTGIKTTSSGEKNET